MTDKDSKSTLAEDGTVIFRYTNDEFLNFAIASLGERLEARGLATVTRDRVLVDPDASIDRVTEVINSFVRGGFKNTHQLTATAHQLNEALSNQGVSPDDPRYVVDPERPFPTKNKEFEPYFDHPGDGDRTPYSDDQLDKDDLEDLGIEDEFSITGSGNLFKLRGTYIGRPSSTHVDNDMKDAKRFADTLKAHFSGEDVRVDDNRTCMACGSSSIPAYKGVEDDNLEMRQGMNPLITESASPKPMGIRGGLTSNHRGRCASCLLAGMYFAVMRKPVYRRENQTYRVFTPVGDLESLSRIARKFRTDDSLLKDLGGKEAFGRNIGSMSTESYTLQIIDVFSEILKRANVVSSESSWGLDQYKPTEFLLFDSSPTKSGNPARGVNNLERVTTDDWAYTLVQEQESESNGSYWPVDDVLPWFASISYPGGGSLRMEKNMVGEGLLEKDLEKLERGVFLLMKATSGDAETTRIPKGQKIGEYFTEVMGHMANAGSSPGSKITDEDIESLHNVGKTIGEMFYERDDVGLLTKLHNASTQQEFIETLETVAVQMQKNRTAQADASDGVWYEGEDQKRTLSLLNNPETFESAKHMLVIHTSLSAQQMKSRADYYEKKNNGDSE